MKPRYTKPQARDLGGYRSMLASGQWDGPPFPGHSGVNAGDELFGQCRDGGQPYLGCQTCGDVGLGNCNPTGTTPTIVPGCTPTGLDPSEDPSCRLGSNALVGCKTGSIA